MNRSLYQNINLRDDIRQSIMFSQEGDEFVARPVHGEVPGLHLLSAQHRLKELLAAARPLPLLRHVEVQDTHWTHLVGLPRLVQEEQLLPADLEHPDDGSLAAPRRPVHQHVDSLTLGCHHLRAAGDRVLEVLGRGARLPHHVKHGANLLENTKTLSSKFILCLYQLMLKHVECR